MKKSKKYHKLFKTAQFFVLDAFSILFTYFSTILVLRVWEIEVSFSKVAIGLPLVLAFKLLAYYIFGLYKMIVKHVGFEDIIRIAIVAILSNTAIALFFTITGTEFINKMSYFFITPLEIILIALPRIIRRIINFFKSNFDWTRSVGKRTLIIGAGGGGEQVLKEIYKNKTLNNIPVAFVDDDKEKIGSKLLGIKVIGPISDINTFIEDYKIEEVIVAIANITTSELHEIVTLVAEKNIKLKRLPLMAEVGQDNHKNIIDVKVEDLLNRGEIHLDNKEIYSFIKGKVVLVTGGGGSIGSELCRQIVKLEPKQLIIFDIYENNAYDIQMEIERSFSKSNRSSVLKVLIGSVYNYSRIEEIFKSYHPNIVFHAAACKHVPLMEDSAVEAVRTNIIGTYNVVKLSDLYNVANFVFVSSDKAVRPTNVMGATKRYAEMILEAYSKQSQTKFSAVRFGNVLGSNGSVVPLFKKQIEDGGPVTVTHPDITRFFMTIPEAVSLILQSAVYSKGGDIFILDMGEPVRIKDLAEKMIRLAGYKPYVEMEIEYTGLRPGEKLFEELLLDVSKNHIKTENSKIYIEANGKEKTNVFSQLEELSNSYETLDNLQLKLKVASVVKAYNFNGHLK